MPKALILSGGGRFCDPWHPFAATSRRLAEIAEGLRYTVEVSEELEGRLADLAGVDLVIVNATDAAPTDARVAAMRGIRSYLRRGGAVFAIHVGAATLLGMPDWEDVTGMAWVDGKSMHPDLGPAHVLAFPDRHPIAAPLRDFDLIDERYCHLRLAADIVPFVAHKHDGQVHPLAWARSYGRAKIVVDALGHGSESYDSFDHRNLIARSFQWLTGRLA